MKYFIVLAFCICSTFIYSNTIIDKKGSDGVITRTVTFTPGDKEYESLQKLELTYNSNGSLTSRKLIFNDQYSKKSDLLCQEEILNPLGIVEKYIVTFTDDYLAISGLKKQIESVDNNDNIIDIEYYSNEKSLFKEKFQNRQINFPFYKISYLNNILFADYVDNPNGTNYGLSMKYSSATSLVKFIEEPIDINDNDKDFLTIYAKSRNVDSILPLYSKKVLVQEGDKKYYVMIQNKLLDFVKVNESAAISHYFGTRDKEFMIICIGFTDIK